MAESTFKKDVDHTSGIESELAREKEEGLGHLARLFTFVLSSAKAICGIYLLLTVSLSLLRPLLAYLWGRYIDLATAGDGTKTLPLVGLILAYYLISFICELIDRYTIPDRETIEGLDIVQMNRLQELFHTKLYGKIAALLPEYMEVPRINDLIEQVFTFSGDSYSDLNRQVMVGGYLTFAKAVSVLAIAATLWFFHPLLTLLVLLAALPTLYTTTVHNKLKFKFIKDNTKLRREFQYYEDLMRGPAAKEIKSLGLYEFFFAKWQKLNEEYTARERKALIRTAALGFVSTTISTLASVGGSVLAILLMVRGQISLGELGSVLVLVRTLVFDTSVLFTQAAAFISKKQEASVFFALNDLPEEPRGGLSLNSIKTITLKDLSYRYPLTERYVLQNINLKIEAGEKIALVGENGAGKTTLVKIISGMLSPSKGELLINDVPAEKVKPQALYQAMSAVMQEPARYNTFTVSDNVFIGDTEICRSEEKIARALKKAGFSGPSPQALLGKDLGGIELSGGEWQKLAIARGWYRDRDFIILDEPTSNLDPLAEEELFLRYLKLTEGRTVILVTHRISIAALCDRVLVLKGGRIFEDGSHHNLLGLNGEYAKLHGQQAHWYRR